MTQSRLRRSRSVRPKAAPYARGALPPSADMLMLAPMVMAMRWPTLWWEFATPMLSPHRRQHEGRRAVVEKAAAVAESYGATHAQIAHSMTCMWIGAMAGETPDATLISRSFNDIADATMEPHARRVRANYRRLRAATSRRR